MKAFWKILTLLLALLMLAVPLASCKDQGAQDEAKTTEDGDGTQMLDEPIVLCNAKESFYRVVRPKTTMAPINDAMSIILEYPAGNAASNLLLRWGSDENAPSEKEILIGYTNRPESLEVLKSIGYDDFAIVQKNGKIVVAAHKPERLLEAAEFLRDNLLDIRTNAEGEKEFVYLGDYTFKSPDQTDLFADDGALKNYVIVYKKDSTLLKSAAERLQTELRDAFDVELALVDDSVKETEYEILIGNVDRALAKKRLGEGQNLSIFSAVTVVEGKKLLIGARTDEITNYMIDIFCSDRIKPQYTYTLSLTADTNEIGNAFLFSESTELAEGADMRVMSYNILCEHWNELAVIKGRQIPVVSPIFAYQPDILGMQEVSAAWYKELDPLFGNSYAFVDRLNEINETNYSPLVYNTKTVTLLEHGVKNLKVGNISGLRVLSWGYFERKSDGARFVAVNTHWNVSADPNARTAQAQEMAEFVLSMKAKYNCPVITTGDYNTRASDTQFELYTSTSGLRDACLNSKTVNRVIKTTHKLFESPDSKTEGEAIDHIFASSEIELLYYNVLVDPCLDPSSDHCPIYADVKLGK